MERTCMSISALWFLITLSSLVSYIIYGMFNLTKPDQKNLLQKIKQLLEDNKKKAKKKEKFIAIPKL